MASLVQIIFSSGTPAAAATNDLTTEIIIAVLGAGGVGAILAAIITGLFSKRKLGAEATEIITKAAAGVVTNLQDELNRQQSMMAGMASTHAAQMADKATQMAKMEADHARQLEEVRRVLQLHVAWDAIAIAKMAELDIDLPPAPPLLPPLLEMPRGGIIGG